MKRKRIAILGAIVIVLAALSFPLANLTVGPPANTLAGLETSDPVFAKAAGILGAKCVNCHTTEYRLPFYAKFPIAKQAIEFDIHEGTRYMNYVEALVLAEGQPVGEVTLAKTEQALVDGSMPPMRYLALHWDGGLSGEEHDAVMAWIHQTRAAHYATGLAAAEFADEIVQPLPLQVVEDPRKVALGDKLYHDKRLSTDDSLACAGCHGLDKGGTDQLQFSEGVGGEVGGINAPTTFNAGYQFLQFWDGRAADLEEQADGPVTNPIEMASSWPEAIPKLEQDEELKAAFLEVYPEGYSKESITNAIAAFERTLITPNCRFDQYLMGQANAITAEERRGYETFKQFNCATCHVGKIMGGQSFERMGLKADYFADRGDVGESDYGRFNVTKKEEDRYRLKTPTLRNIALTFPYLHDGSTSDLVEVVEIMAKYQVGRDMSEAQIADVVAFLNTLTGEYNGQPL